MNSLKAVLFLCFLSPVASAQAVLVGVDSWSPVAKPGDDALLVRVLDTPTPNPRPQPSFARAGLTTPQLSPELVLAMYQRRSAEQGAVLAAYSSATLVRAELPSTSQRGEFELQRRYAAPRTLEFKPVRYTGDGFVKSNVIARVLQTEVDHVQKGNSAQTALNSVNYKFSYKGMSRIDGRDVYVYQVKPHKKRPGLFKGRISLDATTGSLVRTEGKIVKSPSFFVKNIEFLQDFADVGRFTFPVRLHSEATARIVGRTVVDVFNHDFQTVAANVETAKARE